MLSANGWLTYQMVVLLLTESGEKASRNLKVQHREMSNPAPREVETHAPVQDCDWLETRVSENYLEQCIQFWAPVKGLGCLTY